MMGKSDNHEIPGELLSAWCDGELSLEEQARVEQLLQESPAARREAEEIAQLSSLLKSLPRESAPPELISATLRRCEREMLLGTAAGGSSDDSASPTVAAGQASFSENSHLENAGRVTGTADNPQQAAAGSSHSFFRSTAVAVTGLALSLVFVVTAAWQLGTDGQTGLNSQSDQVARTEKPAGEFSADAAESAADLMLAREEGLLSGEGGSAADDLVASREMDSASEPAAASFAAEPAPGVARMAVRDHLARPHSTDLQNRADGLPSAAVDAASPGGPKPIASVAWQEMRAGDIVRVLDREDGQIAVVELTVVNVSQSLGELQILLSRQAIGELASDAGAKDARELPRDRTADESRLRAERPAGNEARGVSSQRLGDDIAAVFVQSTPEQLARVIQGMQREKQFADLQLASAVSPDRVELASSLSADEAAAPGRSAAEQLTVADLDRSLLESTEQGTRARTLRMGRQSSPAAEVAAARGKSAAVPPSRSVANAPADSPAPEKPAESPAAQPAAPVPPLPAGERPRSGSPAAIAATRRKADATSSRRPVVAPTVPGTADRKPEALNRAAALADAGPGSAAVPLLTASQSFQMVASVRTGQLKETRQDQLEFRQPVPGKGTAVRESAPAATSPRRHTEKAIAATELKKQQNGGDKAGNTLEAESQLPRTSAGKTEVAGKTVRPVRVLFVVRKRDAAGS